ncbi:MAG TPA: hypothetical protein VGF14_05545 [Alphaproteobacteria bacterium]
MAGQIAETETTAIATPATLDTLKIADLTIIKLRGEKREIQKGKICGGVFDQKNMFVDSADFVLISQSTDVQHSLAEGMSILQHEKDNITGVGDFNLYHVGTVEAFLGHHFHPKGLRTKDDVLQKFVQTEKTVNGSMDVEGVYPMPFNHYLNTKKLPEKTSLMNKATSVAKNPTSVPE